MQLSDLQHRVANHGWTDPEIEHLFVSGPYGSGKSAAAIRGAITWVVDTFTGGEEFLFLAKDKDQLRAVIERELLDWAGENDYLSHLDIRGERKRIRVRDTPDGRPQWATLYLRPFGDGNKLAHRIQGMNLRGFVCDEAVNLPESALKMLFTRLRAGPHRKAWWLMNPDSDRHPFYTGVICGDYAGEHITLPLAANPALPKNYVETLTKTFPHEHEYRRYVLGEWCSASGLCWPTAALDYPRGSVRPMPDDVPILSFTAGVDWAAKTVTHATLYAHTTEGVWALKEWRHDAEASLGGELTEDEQVAQILSEFDVGETVSVSDWVVDRTSLSMVHALRQEVGGRVWPSAGTREDCAAATAIVLKDEKVFLDPGGVPNLISEFARCKWITEGGRTLPDKKSCGGGHGIDQFGYWAHRIIGGT